MAIFTEDIVSFIAKERQLGETWADIMEHVNAQFNTNFSNLKNFRNNGLYALRHADLGYEDVDTKIFQQNRTVRKTNYLLRKEANTLADELTARGLLIAELEKVVAKINKIPTINVRKFNSKGAHECIFEVLLTDLHIGAKEPIYNYQIARQRLKEYAATAIWEIEQASKVFKPIKIMLPILGDVVANYEFHDLASAVTCEEVTPVQMVWAIDAILEDMILPLASLNIPIEVVCIPGNHDRLTKKQPMHKPGKESLSYVIYHTLKRMTEMLKLKHVKWDIAERSFTIKNIFQNKVLYEHGYNKMSTKQDSCESKIADRQKQAGIVIDFLRFGNFHEIVMYGNGRSICGGSLIGPDGYSTELGYASSACQVICLYVATERRPTTFYRMFPVYLNNIGTDSD